MQSPAGGGRGSSKWGGTGRGVAAGRGVAEGNQSRVQYNNKSNSKNDRSQQRSSQKEQSTSGGGSRGASASPKTIKPQWKERTANTHERHLKQLREGGAEASEVLLLGDSMCERWLSSGKQLWETEVMAHRLRVFNAGVGGDKTQHVLWRLEEGLLGDAKSSFRPQFAILLIGTNNLEGDSAEDIALGIDAIVQVELSTNPESLLTALSQLFLIWFDLIWFDLTWLDLIWFD